MLDRATHGFILDMPRACGMFNKKRVRTMQHFLNYCRILQSQKEEKEKQKEKDHRE